MFNVEHIFIFLLLIITNCVSLPFYSPNRTMTWVLTRLRQELRSAQLAATGNYGFSAKVAVRSAAKKFN